MNKTDPAVPAYLGAFGTGDAKFKDGTPLAKALKDTKQHIAHAFAEQPKVKITVKVRAGGGNVKQGA